MADGRAMGGGAGVALGAGRLGDLADGPLLRRALDGDGATADAAFGVLVARHGPMVWRVCRGALGHAHDAEDAFQATFLVLARRAGSIRRADSVASWLHGVALKVARRARAGAARREALERRAAALRPAAVPGPPAPDLDLHAALAGLPAKLRDPLLLCYFEGLTTDEAADRLGCPRGTVLSRLARGRDRLRATLARSAPPVLAGPAVESWLAMPPAGVPPALADLAARSASRSLAGTVPATLVAARVAALAEGTLRMITWTKLPPSRRPWRPWRPSPSGRGPGSSPPSPARPPRPGRARPPPSRPRTHRVHPSRPAPRSSPRSPRVTNCTASSAARRPSCSPCRTRSPARPRGP